MPAGKVKHLLQTSLTNFFCKFFLQNSAIPFWADGAKFQEKYGTIKAIREAIERRGKF